MGLGGGGWYSLMTRDTAVAPYRGSRTARGLGGIHQVHACLSFPIPVFDINRPSIIYTHVQTPSMSRLSLPLPGNVLTVRLFSPTDGLLIYRVKSKLYVPVEMSWQYRN